MASDIESVTHPNHKQSLTLFYCKFKFWIIHDNFATEWAVQCWHWPAVHVRPEAQTQMKRIFSSKKKKPNWNICQFPHNYYHLVAALCNAVCLPVAAVKYISKGSAACLLLEFLWHLTTTIYDLWHTSRHLERTHGALSHNGEGPCQGRAGDYCGPPVKSVT